MAERGDRIETGGSPKAGASAWVDWLQQPRIMTTLHPVAARFIHALRLIAVHHRARRDPTAELAVRLGSVAVAVKALQLADTIGGSWPEPVQLRRFCYRGLSHDEATIGALVEAAWWNRQDAFEREISGLVRSERIARLWADCVELVASESVPRA
ncbi:MAG: DNA-directed RNA polymerase subunit beta' [Erythrobacter sp.]